MMNMRVEYILTEHKRDLENLKCEYCNRFDNLPVNGFGETSAETLLNLNEWYREEKEKINQIMVDRLKEGEN